MRSAALFPVVKCVEVYTCQIDRLTKAQNGSTQALKIQGGTQLIQERLAGQPLISAFDYDLFSSIAEKILVFSNGSVRLQLQNGKVI